MEYEERDAPENQDAEEEIKPEFEGFFGNYDHGLDVKNRAFVPSKFKADIGARFMLTKGVDKYLMGYRMEDWRSIRGNLYKIPISDQEGTFFKRQIVGNVTECELDKQGRFCIPQKLREYAQLEKDVCFVGMLEHFEIWASDKWKEANDKMDNNIDKTVQKMDIYFR